MPCFCNSKQGTFPYLGIILKCKEVGYRILRLLWRDQRADTKKPARWRASERQTIVRSGVLVMPDDVVRDGVDRADVLAHEAAEAFLVIDLRLAIGVEADGERARIAAGEVD